MPRALLLVMIGCTASLAITPPRPDAQVTNVTLGEPFGVPGESMEYRLALRGLTVGTVQVGVGHEGELEGQRVIIIRSRAATTGLLSMIGNVAWELTTTLDLTRGYPLSAVDETWVELAGHDDHNKHNRTWSSTERVHNVHSAIGVIRGWRSRPSQHVAFDVAIDDMTLDVEITEVGRESLSGKLPAVHYEGTARGKYHFSFWVSDDAQRVPLLLRSESKWGDITVELVEYQSPPD